MIEKLVKEFQKIHSSLNKSKKLILSDIDKIDEKYRKLAQEEKKSLTESLSILNEQLKYYEKMLGKEVEIVEDDTAEEDNTPPVEEFAEQEPEEPVIQDTIFPENNEPEEMLTADKEEEKKGMTMEEIVAGLESAGIVNIDTVVEEKKEEQKKEEAAVEDIPEVIDTDWGNGNQDGEVKLDENGWPLW